MKNKLKKKIKTKIKAEIKRISEEKIAFFVLDWNQINLMGLI